ncbi:MULTISPECIES: hypothetical protein [Halostella]|uniref:hypothetical protein n=1 Tax=Halostella TaxID=1843185 RepID=UPI001080B3C9|nr:MULTISPECIES: hypothetical protein [Halostella]
MVNGSLSRTRTALRENEAVQIADVYDQLETILESIDLEDDPELGDLLIDAVEATDQAYTLASADGELQLSAERGGK